MDKPKIQFNAVIISYFSLLFLLSIFCPYYINYIVLWILIGTVYLFFVKFLPNSWLYNRLEKINTIHLIIILILLSIILRLLFLPQKPLLSTDLENAYVARSQYMLNGMVPYRDFGVNKPPLFSYMLYYMGLFFGAGQVQFRIFFVIIDALIPVVIYFIGKSIWNKKVGLIASLSYVFCPIALVEIGYSGHYDSIPTLFVLLSILFLWKKKPFKSSISLGIASALKIYSVILLPFYLVRLKTWEERRNYLITYLIPVLLSVIPILILYPRGLLDYLNYQTVEWEPWGMISGSLVKLSGQSIFGLKITMLVLFVFAVIILAMLYLTWIKKKQPFETWFTVIILSLILSLVLLVLYGFSSYLNLILLSIIFFISLILIILVYSPIKKFLMNKIHSGKQDLLIVSLFAIMFLIIGSPQFHPWYLIWMLPFVFLIQSKEIKWFFLTLFIYLAMSEYAGNPSFFSGLLFP